MSVITRMDARSENNKGFEIRDATTGRTIAIVEALGPKTELRISTSADMVVVKSNGKKLVRKQ